MARVCLQAGFAPPAHLIKADGGKRADEAALAAGGFSAYQWTDEEKLLRELAYPMIRPPYSREQWWIVLGEWRRTSAVPYYGETYDYAAYAASLLGAPLKAAAPVRGGTRQTKPAAVGAEPVLPGAEAFPPPTMLPLVPTFSRHPRRRVTTTHTPPGSGSPRLVLKKEDMWDGERQPIFWLSSAETSRSRRARNSKMASMRRSVAPACQPLERRKLLSLAPAGPE